MTNLPRSAAMNACDYVATYLLKLDISRIDPT
jgi:hypothetical protein